MNAGALAARMSKTRSFCETCVLVPLARYLDGVYDIFPV